MPTNQPTKAFGIIDVIAAIPKRSEPDALVLDLPLPPSINSTCGLRLGNRHPKVQRWRKSADAHLLFTKQSKKLRLIEGAVSIEIWWDVQMVGDIDNRIKHLLDYLERLNIVTKDSQCRRLLVDFGSAPDGCRVCVRAWDWER